MNLNNKRKLDVVLLIFRIISIVIIIVCLIYIAHWYLENRQNSGLINNITSSSITDTLYIEIPQNEDNSENSSGEQVPENTVKLPVYELDFPKLLSVNNSTVGWLKVPNTTIDYPVVKASDNIFYLTHSFDKSKNSAGWIFADYRNKFDGSDRNIIIYGHNRMDSSMFATLRNTQNSSWFNNPTNKYLTFTTPDGVSVYEVFSTYTIKAETYYMNTIFASDNDYLKFLNTLKSRSIKNFNVELSATDSILTLSTCDATGKSRIILHAKKIM